MVPFVQVPTEPSEVGVRDEVPNSLESKVSECQASNLNLVLLANTPIKFEALSKNLDSYHCKESDELREGFRSGFSLHYSGPRSARDSKNLKSVNQNLTIVQEKIDKEVSAGRMAGPFELLR